MRASIRCTFGMHDWRLLPKFKSRDFQDDWSNPTKICKRCFKTWRKRYDLRIPSAEGPGWRYYMPPYWEGQTPPAGYSSWTERNDNAVYEMLKRAK